MDIPEKPWKGTVMGAMLLAALGILFFLPWAAGDKIFFPQHTGSFLPWRDRLPPRVLRELDGAANPLMADKVFMFQPELVLSRNSIREGRLPLWDPYTLGGIPHLAQGMPAPFDLLNLFYLVMPPERAYIFTGFLQCVLGAVFMLLFLRALEIRHFAATMGGLVFGFSGWMLVHLHYYMITGAALWLPLILLGTERILRGGRAWWILATALGTFETLCAGFPQIAVMNLYLATAYAIFRAAPGLRTRLKTGIRRLALAASGIFLGLLLSGIQLLPSMAMAYSKDSTRTMATLDQIRGKPLPLACLAAYLAPDLFGHPDLTRMTESAHYNSLLSTAVLPQRDDVNYVEIHGYVGLLPFLLAVLILATRARKGWIFFGAAFAFCLLTALGMPGIVHLTAVFPGLMVGDVKRFLFPAAACLSILSAFTLDAFWEQEDAGRIRRTGLAVVLILLVCFGSAWLGVTSSSREGLKEAAVSAIHRNTGLDEQEIRQAITRQDFKIQRDHLAGVLLRTVLFLGLAAAGILLSSGKYRDWPVSRPLLVAILVLDLFGTGWRFNRPMPGELPLYDASDPVVAFLKANTGPARIIRYKENLIYPVNSGAVHGIRDAQGYTAFYFQRYRRLLDRIEEGRSNAYGMYCLTREAALASPVLDAMAVKYVLSPERIDLAGLREALHSRSLWVYENTDALPRAYLQRRAAFVDGREAAAVAVGDASFDPHECVVIEGARPQGALPDAGGWRPAAVVTDENEWVAVDVEGGPGWLVLCDAFCEDWIAELDGEPVQVHPANLAFRAVEIPDGSTHRVAFRYRPRAVRMGAMASLAGVILCAALAGFLFLRSGKLRKN